MSKMTAYEFNQRRQACLDAGIGEGSIWQHYKGGVYVVLGFTIDTHHGGFLVVYRRIGGPDFNALAEAHMTFSRPPEEWQDLVNPAGGRRFCKITD